jgi:phosphoribosylformylglycinamidine synthase I
MKIGVVVFPGSNCDQDMIYTLQSMNHEVVELWHKDTDLQGVEMVALPGGFSYGDYLRSGAIARLSPIMDSVIEFANKGGYVLGVCNGFQVLCESGLLPGTLLHNTSHTFVCKNVYLNPVSKTAAISASLDSERSFKIPVAHGEGRYYASDEALNLLESNDQVLFRYADANGIVNDAANFNGASRNIAGVCNAGKNVFGMMPHPERAADSNLGNEDGRLLFDSLFANIQVTSEA